MRIMNRQKLARLANRLLRPFDIELVRPSELWGITSMLGNQPPPNLSPPPGRPAYLRVFGPPTIGTTFDFSVVMATILRPSIIDALRSIFAQNFPGTVQTVIGVDQPINDINLVEVACCDRPPNHTVMVPDPGYSTSSRHGGLSPDQCGGVLRNLLSHLAASQHIAYLDDDNWWAPNHLSSLAAALNGFDWAWSRRHYVHPATLRVVCEDIWDSLGPYAGTYAAEGGWVDPNCLAIDKLRCEAVLRWWGIPQRRGDGMDSDRNVYRVLHQEFRGNGTGMASTYYVLNDRALYERGTDNRLRIDRIGRSRYEACATDGR